MLAGAFQKIRDKVSKTQDGKTWSVFSAPAPGSPLAPIFPKNLTPYRCRLSSEQRVFGHIGDATT